MCGRAQSLWILAGVVAAGIGLVGADQPAPPSYEVVEVKKKLYQVEPAPEIQLQQGATPTAGTLLRTGSSSWAVIESPESGVRFRLGAKTRARLASESAGVLLELEQGRLRAVFGTLVGTASADRLVTTPTAVLAVRGTEYGVEVDGKGRTTVTVFSGEVHVRHRDGAFDPATVTGGQYLRIQRGKPIEPARTHYMKSGDWDMGRRPDDRPPRPSAKDSGPSGQSGYGSGGGGSSSGSGSGGSRGGGGRG